MSKKKFVIACPNCGKYAEADSGFFAKKKISCTCGHIIDVRTEKMASTTCKNCHHEVVYDQSLGADAKCPICGTGIAIAKKEPAKYVNFHCDNCGCALSVEKGTTSYTCPLCETEIDVEKEAAKEKALSQGIASIVKYDGEPEIIAWKHPLTTFNKGSQCIVREGQEAIFLRDGKALEPFKPGRHTLSYEDCPQLDFLRNTPDGGSHTFHSEVYFVNTTTQMGIKWGTNSKVRLFDPGSGMHIEIGACGTYNLAVVDSGKLLSKVIGTAPLFSRMEISGGVSEMQISIGLFGIGWSVEGTTGKFKDVILNAVKGNLARTIKAQGISILEIDEHLDLLGEDLRSIINESLVEYGLELSEFFITSIATPDDDPDFRRLKRQYAERVIMEREEGLKTAETVAVRNRRLAETETAAQISEAEAKVRLANAQNANAEARLNAEAQAEIARINAMAEADVIKAKGFAEAEAYKAQAMAEAMERQAKGISYEAETARLVGMEAMKNGITGQGYGLGGLTSGIAGDMASIGLGKGVMEGVKEMTKKAMSGQGDSGFAAAGAKVASNSWQCPSCGADGLTSKCCPECGTKRPEAKPAADSWTCPECGTDGITSKFCPECGTKRPEAQTWTCPECGAEGLTSKCCPECGTKKPEGPWTCPECGESGITSKFCPECGAAKA